MNINNFFTGSSMVWFKQQQLLSALNDVAIFLPVFLIIFTWRGFIQAFAAKIMGDKTAEQEGFLTLNPLAHIDALGLLVVIGIFFFIGGLFGATLPRSFFLILLIMLGVRWTIPVPIVEQNFKKFRLGGIVTALSGSAANILLAFIGVIILRLLFQVALPGFALTTLMLITQTLIDMSLFFSVLDLIPLPPFDGGRLLRYALPYSAQHIVDWLESYSLFIFLFLFIVPGVSDVFFGGIASIALTIKKFLVFIVFR